MIRRTTQNILFMSSYETEIILCLGKSNLISQKDIFRKLDVAQSNCNKVITILEKKGFILKKKLRKVGYIKNYYFLSNKGKQIFNYINKIRALNSNMQKLGLGK